MGTRDSRVINTSRNIIWTTFFLRSICWNSYSNYHKENQFIIEIFRLLIGAIAGYECLVIGLIFLKDSFTNPNEILKVIIDFHHGILEVIIDFPQIDFRFFIPGMLGAIGASIAIFMMGKVFRWCS
ncbi:hypothetical protein [Nostoc sp.]|uniref:hypothetical protein n=1 Tax=Nostoc sp. TaxID=1180 RepID=UPI002FFCFA4A